MQYDPRSSTELHKDGWKTFVKERRIHDQASKMILTSTPRFSLSPPHQARNDGTSGGLEIPPSSYSDFQVSISSILSGATSLFWTAISNLTLYGELSSAQDEKDFQRVRIRLQSEWICIGALLVEIVTVDATIFAISPDAAAFKIRSSTYLAVVTSSVASGFGIVCVTWFHLRYQWIDIETFIIRSRDVYGTYFFFSLSSRVPAFCILIASLSLMTFIVLIAYDTWPDAVLVLGIILVMAMFLQFLIYAVHLFTSYITRGFFNVVGTPHAVTSTGMENV